MPNGSTYDTTEDAVDTSKDYDPVNHPRHYTISASGVECIDVTEHMNFNRGNAVKYIWRAGDKPQPGLSMLDATIRDLEKAAWYVHREIQRLRRTNMTTLEKQRAAQEANDRDIADFKAKMSAAAGAKFVGRAKFVGEDHPLYRKTTGL